MTAFSQITAGFAPRNDVAVIVACDANYLPYAAIPALQLAEADRGYDVLIGGPEPLELPPLLRNAGIAHLAARQDQIMDALPTDARRSVATYMELFAAAALRGIYRRILVLDSDVVFERGDPRRLLCADMGGHAVAAVRDNRQWRTPKRRMREFRELGLSARPYFNAGVVMIDTEAWAEHDLTGRAAGFARDHLAGLGRDQALMNGVLAGDWAEISPLWNWQFTWSSAQIMAIADPCIVHFIGPHKPWLDSADARVPMRLRKDYAAILPRHFPDAPRGAALDRRHWPARRDLGKSMFKQWRAVGPMLEYLGRFPDEYTLLQP
ncbi:Lipopolysaccharide biosynthesis protein, LPS:glycosyltransferase [Paracoccus isoporae]|uniref:Lipopolysaccharide biosynthesis protein, LPS:glycosyltransferase n=1 Tax=Paracoccus isoporae TaxID=591205 RepID=A0A1G7AKH0_9RHOB|nr:glycosyltransferase [Paracoccus isoporae]SDE15398.1 Lipopolysaccharide biosynthesis protein, LPS:glycosyltransferase [Paracoccus isoporae]